MFREDASNRWTEIPRNRLRHGLLPLLRRRYQPALERVILRLMDVLGEESEFLIELAQGWIGHRLGQETKPDSLWNRPFSELPVALQRRCLQLQLLRWGVAGDFDLVERLRLQPGEPTSIPGTGKTGRKAKGARAAKPAAPPPRVVWRDPEGILQFQEPKLALFGQKSVGLTLKVPAGKVRFDGTEIRWRFNTVHPRLPRPRQGAQEWFDANCVGSNICLRHWQPGDRFQPIGLGKSVKLQDFFTNEKIPRRQRHELIVATTGEGEIFWVEGLRISERFKLTPQTNRCLQLRWKRL
jgi:tRNA(Ile)-lysidine synthase